MTKRKLSIAGIALIAACGAVALATGRDAARSPAQAEGGAEADSLLAQYELRLRQLDRTLKRERGRRAKLAEQVAALGLELERLRERPPAQVAAASDVQTRDETQQDEPSNPSAESTPGEGAGPRGLDVEALVAVGFPADTVRTYEERIAQIELDRLYLRDLAAREGWLDTPRFRDEMGDLSLSTRTREEFGEEFYDWMLYTTGHPNRVRVDDVIDGSVAAEAGLLSGDLILSYDEQRVFSPHELRDATAAGVAGEATAISVLRDGRETRVYVPRGPLGIRIEYATGEPPPLS